MRKLRRKTRNGKIMDASRVESVDKKKAMGVESAVVMIILLEKSRTDRYVAPKLSLRLVWKKMFPIQTAPRTR